MAVQVLYDAAICVGRMPIKSQSNKVTLENMANPLDATVFGGDTKKNVPGVRDCRLQAQGFADYESGTLVEDDTLDSFLYGTATKRIGIGAAALPLLAMHTDADGETGWGMLGVITGYQTFGAHGELFPFDLQAESAGKLVRGTVMLRAAALAGASGAGTIRQLGAISATQKLYAVLVVTGWVGAGTLDVVVASDDAIGFASPTTRVTFAQAAGKAEQWVELAGPITDTYWRVSWTAAGITNWSGYVLLAIQ